MIRFSESVSPCHPDKVADFISEYLLDRYLEKDPKTRYAVEVQIKDSHVTLGGEVSSKVHFNKKKIGMFVREAVNKLGYTKDYQIEWGKENTICGDDLNVTAYIGQQSPEIAQGVDNDGWGDQGIFFGMAAYGDDPKFGMMPKDFAIARWLNRELFHSGLGGFDIKTQVVMDDDKIRRVIFAIPLHEPQDKAKVEEFIRSKVKGDYTLIVNGTGAYVRHSSIADSGTTGRKLAVDFYGSGCKVGGGSAMTKDGSKADVALNLFARKLAKQAAMKHKTTCYTSLACCIGQEDVDYTVTKSDGSVIDEGTMRLPQSKLVHDLGLDKPIFESLCDYGLFGEFQADKAWEKVED